MLVFVDVSRQTKVGHFQNIVLSYQHVSGGKIAVDTLKNKQCYMLILRLTTLTMDRIWTVVIEMATHIVLTGSQKSGGAVASWLVRSPPDRAVRVRALSDHGSCVVFLGKTRNSSPLNPGEKLDTSEFTAWDNPAID